MDKVTQLDFFDIIDNKDTREEEIEKYKLALRLACVAICKDDHCEYCVYKEEDKCEQKCIEARYNFFLLEADKLKK